MPEIAVMAIRTRCIDGILLVSHMHLKAEMKMEYDFLGDKLYRYALD